MNTVKAKICKIQIGHLEIEGLMLPDGTFAVAVVQISSLFRSHKTTLLKS